MKTKTVCRSFIALVFGVCGFTVNQSQAIPSHDNNVTVNAIADFGWDFYRQLSSNAAEKNIFYSPASISTAFFMVYMGAKDNTAVQMAQALHFPMDQSVAAPNFGRVLNQLQATEEEQGYRLATANKVWVSDQLALNSQFLQRIKDDFRSDVAQTNFLSAAAAAQAINEWVAANTANKIPTIISSSAIDRDMPLFLANAVYFKGAWQVAFRRTDTAKRDFFLDRARLSKIRVDTMKLRARLPYAENDEAEMVRLAFRGDISMSIILPKINSSLSAVEQKLSRQYLASLAESLAARPVNLYLPKFTYRSTYDLRSLLAKMGMSLPFSNGADFSGISTNEALKISQAIHKGFIDVNEEGAEAAATTGIGTTRTSAGSVTFRIDRPFIFVIHTADNLPLFVGRIADPTQVGG